MISKSLKLKSFLILILVATSLLACSCSVREKSLLEDTAVEVQNIVQVKLDKLDINISEAATE
jgi:hypothetical protein